MWQTSASQSRPLPNTSQDKQNCENCKYHTVRNCAENLKRSFLMKIKSRYSFTRRIQSLLSHGTFSKTWIQTSKIRSLTSIDIHQALPCLPGSRLWSSINVLYTWMGKEGRAMLSTQKLLQVIKKSCQQEFNFNLAAKHFNSLPATQLKFNTNGKNIFLPLSHRRKKC